MYELHLVCMVDLTKTFFLGGGVVIGLLKVITLEAVIGDDNDIGFCFDGADMQTV